jgi:polar amino acid transport system substrate-binding protein
MQYFTGAEPVSVFAEALKTGNSGVTPFDNVSVLIRFSNGSVGNLVYMANGDKGLPKERVEVFGGGSTAIIDDFREGSIYRNGKRTSLKSSGKGHREEVKKFLESIRNGEDSPISFRSICLTTLTTFKILESLYTGMPQEIHL